MDGLSEGTLLRCRLGLLLGERDGVLEGEIDGIGDAVRLGLKDGPFDVLGNSEGGCEGNALPVGT